MDNLKLAFNNAKHGKDYPEIKIIEEDLDYYLQNIQDMLIDKSFDTSEYEVYLKEDKGKIREIYKLPFYPDRIVQWAVMLKIEDLLINRIPHFSCASIPNRGPHYASYMLRKYIKQSGYSWYIQLDIKQYFPSILHSTVESEFCRIFKDDDLLDLLFNIVRSLPDGSGVPIGNYTSQYFANINLVPYLNWLKHELKVKYVIVYMDDLVILGPSKEYLNEIYSIMQSKLWDMLNLQFKSNYKIYEFGNENGIDFVGYVHYKDYTLLRKSTKERLIRKCRDIKNRDYNVNINDCGSIGSRKGLLKHCNSKNLSIKYLSPIEPYINMFYKLKREVD